ncbi:MAG: DUF1156 domain-containing protein [Thermofilaceae archaeon]
MSERRFIETHNFPVEKVNQASAGEKKGGGRPPHWEMVFWWTRKPLAGARAVIAAALLPEGTPVDEFLRITKLSEKTPHRHNPTLLAKYAERFRSAKLLDPFAGFGSIPLEAVRLGIGEVVAVELLPTAYVFLKAVIEHPKWIAEKKMGQKFLEDLKRWGNWIVEQLKNDPDIRELYDEDVAVYIGTWEVKCPHCNRYTPLVGNWWLARVSGRGEEEEESEEEEEEEGARRGAFERLVWMEPVRQNGEVYIRVVNLNRELRRETITARVNARQGVVEAEGRRYAMPRPNIDARKEVATCLLCNNQIGKGSGGWYIKEALRDWNQKLEQYLAGEIDLDALLKAKARPRLLVKVKLTNEDLEFEPATPQDTEKLWKAAERLRQIWGDPDIPVELIPPYASRYLFPILYGFDKWFKLFNPRQLLTLIKLIKLIRQVGKKVEEERLKEGWSEEDAFRYAEAVTSYLAITICKHADWNSNVSGWQLSYLIAAHTLAMRGIATVWNWGEYNPLSGYRGTFKAMWENAIDSIWYLVTAVSSSPSKFRILLDDATILSSLGNEKFDIIVTDPPYRDDVAYAELSDFYFVWLKRALGDVRSVAGVAVLAPRFYPEAFFKEGVEIETQWKEFASKEVSESEGRARYFGVGNAFAHFKSLLNKSFVTMARLLRDDGLLITYYAHTSPEAWEALLEAGWLGAGLRITAAHGIVTESAQRVTARGKTSLDTSIVAVWRKGVSGEALADQIYAEAVKTCAEYADRARRGGLGGADLFVATLGCVLSKFTQYKSIVGVGDLKRQGLERLVREYIYPAAAESIARSLGAYSGGARLSPPSLFYLLVKVLVPRGQRAARRRMDRSSVIIFAIGTRSDIDDLRRLRIVERDRDRFTLLEPPSNGELRSSLEQTLTERGLRPSQPALRCAVDALHLLEHFAVTLPKDLFMRRYNELKTAHLRHVEEAEALAKVLYTVLPREDREKAALEAFLKALGIAPSGELDSYIRQ